MVRPAVRRGSFPVSALVALCVLAGCSFFKKPPSPGEEQPVAPGEEAAAPAPVVPADPATRAERAFEGRGTREGTLAAIGLWEEALGEDPKRIDVLTSLARATVWLAAEQTTDAKVKEKLLLKAKGYAELVLANDKQNVGAKYWLAQALLHLGEAVGAVDRTIHRYKGKAKDLFQEVLDADETYDFGGAHRFFGRYNAEGSAILGADFAKSYMHFNRAIDIKPDFFPSTVEYVRFTLLKKEQKNKTQAQQDRAKAKELLHRVMDTPSSSLPEAIPENELAKAECRQILEKEFGEKM